MASDLQSDHLTFEKALRFMSPTLNPSDLYKLLTFIRKCVEWPKHRRNIVKIHKSGCIKKILACLNSSHSNIIAVSLSILGNCCLESKCSNEVASKGIYDLYHLVQKYPKNDSVNGRVFRIIGNICQHYHAEFIVRSKGHMVSYILNFIQKYADEDESKICEATMLMAVRAVGKFMNRQTYSSLVDNHDILRPIGALFIKCCEKWTSEKKDQAILEHIIKFLYVFSKYKYSRGLSQLRDTSRGDCLMYLSQVLCLAPQIIVNMVMNFISISHLKSDLPIRDITAGFVKLLKEASSKDEITKQHKDYIKCLCFLLDNPINRDPDRCDDTIPQLIRTFDDMQNPSNDMVEVLCLILETFERCTYHQNIMKQQLDNNMIEVLVNKIEALLGSRKYLKIKHKLVKIRQVEDSIASHRKHFWDSLPDSSDEEIELPNTVLPPFRPSSPGSGSDSEIFISPWASPRASTPPVESTSFYLQESDSEDYSPVCSENEGEENSERHSIQEESNEDFVEVEMTSYTDNVRGNVGKISEEDLKYRLIHHSLSLIKIYSNMQPLPAHLCSGSLMMILVKCACYFESTSKATNVAKFVIMKILSVHEYLIPLMQTGVIYSIFSLLETDHGYDCEKCRHFQKIGVQVLEKFTELIESGGGRGDIAHRLIRGTEEQKKQLAMAIPYIVKFRTTLHTLMINCKGMKILVECLKDEKQRRKCLEVICVLVMRHLTVLNPCQCLGLTEEKMYIENYEVPEDCKNIVTFVLDDNSRVSADRDALCEKSSYFNTLLNGAFKESNEECVKLQQTKYWSLKCLIYLLNCNLDMSTPKDIQVETQTLLDVIMLCHRYLLDELCLYLTICVRQFCLSAKNLPIIYKWALESRTNILRLETVTCALKGKDMYDKINRFIKLFDVGYTDLLIGDIETLVSSHITLIIKDK